MTGTLYWTTRRCPAADTLAELRGAWTVFVSTPDSFTVLTATDGQLTHPLPAKCFQLHAFNGTSELRWLADGPTGRAVWLAESAADLPGEPTGRRQYSATLSTQAVLWGLPVADPTADGMSTWREARIGTAHYPCAPGRPPVDSEPHRDRAVLRGVEYVGIPDLHGNTAIVEHRLVTITTVDLAQSP